MNFSQTIKNGGFRSRYIVWPHCMYMRKTENSHRPLIQSPSIFSHYTMQLATTLKASFEICIYNGVFIAYGHLPAFNTPSLNDVSDPLSMFSHELHTGTLQLVFLYTLLCIWETLLHLASSKRVRLAFVQGKHRFEPSILKSSTWSRNWTCRSQTGPLMTARMTEPCNSEPEKCQRNAHKEHLTMW